MSKSIKITVLGAGNVGATIGFLLANKGLASEIVFYDIVKEKAFGEAMDIVQGTPLCPYTKLYSGELEDIKGSDIVIVTVGIARKPGQTRIDLAKINVGIINDLMPKVAEMAPDAVYIVVANPVDVLTYAIIKNTNIPKERVIGSGTLLDTARLLTGLTEHININPQNISAYVLGEHGDSSVVPWSISGIYGTSIPEYMLSVRENKEKVDEELKEIETYMRTSGAKIIGSKGATFFAVSMSVCHICEAILRDTKSILTVSTYLTGQYGIEDVCLSLPLVIGANGIEGEFLPKLTDEEIELLHKSGDALKSVIKEVL